MDTRQLGSRIQTLLSQKNMSRKEFADMTGLTEAAISRYINGQREPKAITLSIIANSLGVSLDELLGTHCENPKILDDAVLLVARSASSLTPEQKKYLLNAVVDY